MKQIANMILPYGWITINLLEPKEIPEIIEPVQNEIKSPKTQAVSRHRPCSLSIPREV